MEDIDFNLLINYIEKSTKKSYETYQIDGKDIPNVANMGGKFGDIVKLERHGEYYGISVEILEEMRPILTKNFVIRLLTMLKKEDYLTPLAILNLSSLDQLQYIIHNWLKYATDNYNTYASSKNSLRGSKKKYSIFDNWIKSVTHDPLLGKIKIVDIGHNKNTGDSVVPPEWIGKEFSDGNQLHEEMNGLHTRINKPPVTYAIIYSMIVQKYDTFISDIKNLKYDTIFYLDWNKITKKFSTELTIKARKNKYQYVKYNNLLIGFLLEDILEPKGKIEGQHSQSKLREVGILVSRLQKSIRRGKYGSKVLIETINSLNISPNYNLPEHGFMRVSAAKQMVWRLFITILEDCRPFTAANEPSLLELILLALITQKVQEYKFTESVLSAIKFTAILAQYNDTSNDLFDWRALPISKETPIIKNDKYTAGYHNALSLALNNMIMMSGDNKMLSQYYSFNELFEPFEIPPILQTSKWNKILPTKKYILHDEKIYNDIVLASFDMHNKTNIILYYQACIPISLTTKQISGYIWDTSSGYNVRNPKKKLKNDKLLRKIQQYFYSEPKSQSSSGKKILSTSKKISDKNGLGSESESKPKSKYTDRTKRTSFLIMFGTKYKHSGKDVILTGTIDEPARVKIKNEWVATNDKSVVNAYVKKTINLSVIDPPFGYKWKEKKVQTSIYNGTPLVNDNKIPFFDGSSLLEPTIPKITANIDDKTYRWIIKLFSGLDIEFDDIIYYRNGSVDKIFNWALDKSDTINFEENLLALTYTKIFNQFNNIIMIGPVDRNGHKMQNSINYQLEGKIWAIFNLFSYLYPNTFRPSGGLNFHVKKDTVGYSHLITTLEYLLFKPRKIIGPVPTIKTKLWDHQQNSVNKIITGFKNGYHGFGDASDVGSGKTLTSLSIATELIKNNNNTYSGILVLLPGNKLIKTWKDELEKHTIGFDTRYQEPNEDVGTVSRNTIVVSTMSRNRDHLINHKWLLVIVDECLTVQNKNALWTESCWKQSLMSKYLIMMSATFYRTRFDKLYYMLKMLQTGLPEKREYLETILLESIVSQVSGTKRNWTSNFNYFLLDTKSRTEYDMIARSNKNVETKFSELTSYLVSNAKINSGIIEQLQKLIKKLEKNKHRCLIYARAKEEAEFWSKKLDIGIYPKKGKHCIVTYHDGTYGLNDLIIYDTIIMRPPPPDLLPQIKGRLDRYGQKNENLFIEYFVMKDTIEEGLILRLNIASQFIQKYIMPLATFYNISVNYKQYKD